MDIDFKKLFGRFNLHSQGGQKKSERDWKMIVVCSLAINLAIIIGSLYAFWSINSAGLNPDSGTSVGVEKFRQSDLDAIIGRFKTRQDDFTMIQSGKPTFADPSL